MATRRWQTQWCNACSAFRKHYKEVTPETVRITCTKCGHEFTSNREAYAKRVEANKQGRKRHVHYTGQ